MGEWLKWVNDLMISVCLVTAIKPSDHFSIPGHVVMKLHSATGPYKRLISLNINLIYKIHTYLIDHEGIDQSRFFLTFETSGLSGVAGTHVNLQQ